MKGLPTNITIGSLDLVSLSAHIRSDHCSHVVEFRMPRTVLVGDDAIDSITALLDLIFWFGMMVAIMINPSIADTVWFLLHTPILLAAG